MPFGIIVPEFWDDARIAERSVEARLLAAFLLTVREATFLPGLMNLGVAGLSEAIRLPVDVTQRALAELVACGFAQLDERARLVRVPRAPRYNGAPNANCLRGWFRRWKAMPSSPLRDAHVSSLKEALPSSAWVTAVWAETFGSLFPPGTQLELGSVPVDNSVSLDSRHLDGRAVDNSAILAFNSSNELNPSRILPEPFANDRGRGRGRVPDPEGGSGGGAPPPDEPPGWLNSSATGPRPRTNGRPQEFAYGSAQVVLGSVGRSNTCTRCGAQEGPRVYEGRDVLCNPCRFGGAA